MNFNKNLNFISYVGIALEIEGVELNSFLQNIIHSKYSCVLKILRAERPTLFNFHVII